MGDIVRLNKRYKRSYSPDNAISELMALRNRIIQCAFPPPSIRPHHADKILQFIRMCNDRNDLIEYDLSPVSPSLPDDKQLNELRELARDMKTIGRKAKKAFKPTPMAQEAGFVYEMLLRCANETLIHLSFYNGDWPEEWRVKRAVSDTDLNRQK